MFNFSKKSNLLLLFVILFPLILRIIVFNELQNSPIVNVPIGDSKTYIDVAQDILDGNFLNNHSTFTNPFYGYFVALVKFIFSFLISKNFHVVFIIQSVLSSFTILIVYKITSSVFDEKTALISVILISIYEILIFFDNCILSVSLINFLNVLMIFLLFKYYDSRKLKFLFSSGLVCGLSIITRANLYIFIPFAVVWFYLINEKNIYRTLKPIAIYLTGVFIFIVLITIRNYKETSEFVVVSSNLGYNFYVGNNEKANGTYVKPDFVHSTDQFYEEKESEDEANLRTGRKLSHNEASLFWLKEGLKFMWHNPAKYFSLLGRKTYLFFNNVETANNLSNYVARDYSKLLKFLPSNFGVISVFGVLGIIFCIIRIKSKKILLIYFYLLTYFFANILIMVSSEYRAPLIMFLIIFTILGLKQLLSLLENKKYFLVTGMVIPVIIFTCWTNYNNSSLRDYRSTVPDYIAYGNLLRSTSHTDEAIDMYLRAIKEDDSNKNYYFEIAQLFLIKKDNANALYYFKLTPNIDMIPDSIKVNFLEIEANQDCSTKNFPEAVKLFRRIYTVTHNFVTLSNLGACLIDIDSLNEAEKVLKEAINLKLDYYYTYANLGGLFETRKMYDSSLYYFEKAEKYCPEELKFKPKIISLYIKMNKIEIAKQMRDKIKEGYSGDLSVMKDIDELFRENNIK